MTLLEMLMEHELHRDWRAGRPTCSVCSLENRQVMWAIPVRQLANLDAAWKDVAKAAAEAKVDLRVET